MKTDKFMVTIFKQANQQLQEGNFAVAVDLYKLALQNTPDLAVMIQFNLKLAQRKLIQNAEENSSLLTSNELLTNFLSHETLQKTTNSLLTVLGGMVIGFPNKAYPLSISPRIAECAQIYEQIAQIPEIHGLRLVSGEEISRIPSPILNPEKFVHSFESNDFKLTSIWYSNSRDLRLSFERITQLNEPQVLRAYQYEPIVGGGLVLLGDFILQREDWQLYDLALINPYLPVILTLSTPEGNLTDATLVPYPSLLPGGIHEHECYADAFGADATSLAQEFLREHLLAEKSGWGLGLLQIDIREAIGTEPVLSLDFKEWLSTIFSLPIKPWRPPEFSKNLADFWHEVFDKPLFLTTSERISKHSAREREGRVLLCSPKAIPSLRALTMSRSMGALEQTCGISHFILVQKGQRNQRWRLRWPDLALNQEWAIGQDGSVRVPMVLLGKNDATKQAPKNPIGVSAIIFTESEVDNSLQLIMPTAPDLIRPSLEPTIAFLVDIVLTATEISVEIFAAFLESLSIQRNISLRQITVILPTGADQITFETYLMRYFAKRYLLLPASEGEQYKQRVQRATAAISNQPKDAYMVFINQPLLLFNPRTLSILAQAFSTPKTSTTSPLLIENIKTIKSRQETVVCASSIFPVRKYGKTQIDWRNENLATAMPRTTLPVASHSDAIFMIKSSVWRKSEGFKCIDSKDENAVHEYLAKLGSKNNLHLLIPQVTVEVFGMEANLNPSLIEWTTATSPIDCCNAVYIEVLE